MLFFYTLSRVGDFMKKPVLALAIVLTFLLAGVSFAKGPTLKVTISGADLLRPIKITDRRRLANFQIWTGPGTSPRNDETFVANWSTTVTSPGASLKRYRVSFFTDHSKDGVGYVIVYAYDPASRKGYVYLPGRGEADYARNTFSIYRGVEGNWFLARKAWDDLAGPLIQGAMTSK